MDTQSLYQPEPFRWPSALLWAGVGSAITSAAMLSTGLPAGERAEVLVLLSLVALMFFVGGAFTGYRDTERQSTRNVVALGAGGVIGVGVFVFIDVAESTGPLVGYFFMGTLYLGVPTAAVGILLGLLGIQAGRHLARRTSE